MSTVLIPTSGDPIHKGHLNIVERALETFDKVLFGIGINPQKTYTFSLNERENLARKVLTSKYGDRISVKSYSGLLTDFAYENQINTIIRGSRNSIDFDFERMLSDINQSFEMGIDTYLLIADKSLSHISSSAVKELQKNHAKNIIDYVPLVVKEALELKISEQYLIGVTGGIGCGKSFLSNELSKWNILRKSNPKSEDIDINIIDIDKIGRYILIDSEEPLHKKIRKDIADNFGKDLLKEDKIDVKHLLTLLFDDAEASLLRAEFEKIMAEPTTHTLRKKLCGLKGIILINSALFVESGICGFVNNNIISVECSEDTRIARLEKRGYSTQQITNRLTAQYSPEDKVKNIKLLIQEHSCGNLIRFENEDNNADKIKELYDRIQTSYPLKNGEIIY